MRTLTIANQKGGCGKTTVAINLSASLAREGRRVLLVDLDPQSHCALGMAVPEEQIDLSILDCLLRPVDGEPLELSRISWQIAPNLDLAPSRPNLASLESKLSPSKEGEFSLRELLRSNESRYDYCVVDCPPHMGLLMKNGLCAADEVIIPVDTGYFSLYGLTQQLATIEHLSERMGVRPGVGVLPNQYDVRTKLAREILAELRQRFRGIVYESVVNFNTKLKEGASFGQPITEFAPNSIGARDFQKLARELITKEPSNVPTAEILEHVERLAADAERLLATTTTLVENKDGPADHITAIDLAVAARRDGRSGHKPSFVSPVDAARPRDSKIDERVTVANKAPLEQTSHDSATSDPADEGPRSPIEPVRPAKATNLMERRMSSFPVIDNERLGEPAPASEESCATTEHEAIDRRIEAVYGVRQDGDVVIFRAHNSDAGEVQLAGDFNDWMPHTTPLRRLTDGDFEARLRLPRGRYRYRLVIDGRWSHDPNNVTVERNEYGEINSVIEVKQ